MEVSVKKTSFRCFDKILSRKLRKEETQDVVVPDTMPDIAEILDTTGVFVIRSKEAAADGVKITGSLMANALYKAEESGELCSIELSVPVDISLEAELPEDEAECTAVIRVLSLESRALNPRKVLVKAELGTQIDCYVPLLEEYAEELHEKEEGIYAQTKTAAYSPVVAVREKTFVLSDELTLSDAHAPAGELLSKNICAVVEDIKTVGSKLVFKGSVNSSLLYRSLDGIPVKAEFSTAFSQIMECDAAFLNAAAHIHVIPTGVYWELPTGGDGRTIHLEAHMLAQATASERMEMRYIADAYSNTYALQLQHQERTVSCELAQSVLKNNLREVFELPVMVGEIVSSRVSAGATTAMEDGIELPVTIHLLCKNVNGELFAAKKKHKLVFRVDIGDGESVFAGDCDLSEFYVAPTSNGAEIRLHAQLQVQHVLLSNIKYVGGLERSEEASDISQLPSLVIMRATQEDDLWRLAKENCSTVEHIAQLNEVDALGERWDQFLLIPKSR